MRLVKMLVVYEKTAQIRHVGHLDLMRAMQRALRRSGVPVAFSKGFNPHLLVSFAAPLSVGMPGKREIMEVPLTEEISEEEFKARLRKALPVTLPCIAVRAVDDRHPAPMAILEAASYEQLITLRRHTNFRNKSFAECFHRHTADGSHLRKRKTVSVLVLAHGINNSRNLMGQNSIHGNRLPGMRSKHGPQQLLKLSAGRILGRRNAYNCLNDMPAECQLGRKRALFHYPMGKRTHTLQKSVAQSTVYSHPQNARFLKRLYRSESVFRSFF